jgi:hypothetical protein
MKKYYPGPSSGKGFGEAGPAWAVAFFIRIALIVVVIVACAITFNSQAQGLPVLLKSFTAWKADEGIVLNWTSSMEKNVSHYAIERSVNGSDYTDIGIIFTENDSHSGRDYRFCDALKNVQAQVLYYRLRMVDMEQHDEYSPIRIIHMGGQEDQPEVLAYPNPVSDQLHITLPAHWQDSKVVIELLNANGHVVKRVVNNKAGQTETLNTSDLLKGIYLVRVSNGEETATQRLVKTK